MCDTASITQTAVLESREHDKALQKTLSCACFAEFVTDVDVHVPQQAHTPLNSAKSAYNNAFLYPQASACKWMLSSSRLMTVVQQCGGCEARPISFSGSCQVGANWLTLVLPLCVAQWVLSHCKLAWTAEHGTYIICTPAHVAAKHLLLLGKPNTLSSDMSLLVA